MSSRHSVSKTTTQSYGGQVVESFLMASFGMVIVGGSLALIWINEARRYQQTRAIRQIRQQLIAVDDYVKDNEGKVVYVSGPLTSHEEVKDDCIDFEMKNVSDAPPAYGEFDQPVSAFRNFLQLKRNVEMLQWEERQETEVKHKIGGQKETRTLYTYFMAWRGYPIRSETFQQPGGHHNPDMPIVGQVFRPSVFYLAQFVVPSTVAECLESRPVFPPAIIWNRTRVEYDGSNWYVIRRGDRREEKVGDVRVSFSAVSGPQIVSLIGKQQGVSLVPCEGMDSVLAVAGSVPHRSMLSAYEQENALFGKALMWLGTFGSVVGFRLLLDPLVTGAVVIPLMSDLVGFAAWGIAVPLGLTTSVITIPFAKLHCRSHNRLKTPVLALYLGSLFASVSVLSVGIANGLKKIMPTKQSVQTRAEGLGNRMGSVIAAFDDARNRR